jgi:hypothetical protein
LSTVSAVKPVVERTVVVKLSLTEKRENDYSTTEIATQSLTIPLPASTKEIGAATDEAIAALVKNVERFRGAVARIDVGDTASLIADGQTEAGF